MVILAAVNSWMKRVDTSGRLLRLHVRLSPRAGPTAVRTGGGAVFIVFHVAVILRAIVYETEGRAGVDVESIRLLALRAAAVF
jgi:hypothetical protein